MKVLLVFNSFGSMSQRIFLECKRAGHNVSCYEFVTAQGMIDAVQSGDPDIIICPFLTKKVPPEIFTNKQVPCLIVHPGIEGDRGPSSIDWALFEGATEWGVTILQAEEEMDAGNIWDTNTFPTQRMLGGPPSKSSLYRFECIDAAVTGVLHCLKAFEDGYPHPRPLDYSNPDVHGRLRPMMKQADRCIRWEHTAHQVCTTILASDSQPGVLETFFGESYFLYGAHVADDHEIPVNRFSSEPKTIVGWRHGAVLIMCGAGAVFISHLKKPKGIKLPATLVLPREVISGLPEIPDPQPKLQFLTTPTTFQEIFYWERNGVCYFWFDFYNGAMNTDQCKRLEAMLQYLLTESSASVLVLMGGLNFFSNGINLNTIEASDDSVKESWRNINAIDDVVKAILFCHNKITVSAFYGNAGAGGVMAALAADHVWAHGGVVLNPSYKRMALYGSEYWTHSLKKRVGEHVAHELTDSVEPISAEYALQIGLLDMILTPSHHKFVEEVIVQAEKMANNSSILMMLEAKAASISDHYAEKIVSCRAMELSKMTLCFQSLEYIQARWKFVYKSSNYICCQDSQQTVKSLLGSRQSSLVFHDCHGSDEPTSPTKKFKTSEKMQA